MRSTFGIAAILTLVVAGSPLHAKSDPARFVGRVEWASITVKDGKKESKIHSGSCVAVDVGIRSHPELDPAHHILVTAAHVVKDSDGVLCHIQGKQFWATVLKREPEHDLAYLVVPQKVKGIESVPLTVTAYSINEDYDAIGFDGETPFRVSGRIGDYQTVILNSRTPDGQTTQSKIQCLRFTGTLKPGMSGGGIFDKYGALKGIIVGADKKGGGFVPLGKFPGSKQ